ncbi:Ca2-binding protein [Aureococcus anophagefferens]|nr:Ca2-binding protein [Aureococcus anophagefferens]
MVARWMLVALSCAAPAASDDFRSAPLPVAFDERLDVLLEERGVYGEVHRIETEAAYVYEKLGARYGKRLQLPRSPEALVNAWPALFGEPFEERREHAAVVVVLHCFSDARRAAALQRWRHAHLKRTRHLFASDRLDVGAGFLGFPDDDGKQGVDFTTTGGKYLGAHRPLLALMFANDTWGGAFDWLAHGDDDTRFELSRLGAYLGARATRRCPSSPFPYRYHPTRGRVHYHNLASWAYGGIGYYVSRGLLAEITRHEWQACADKLVCGNADQRVSTCLFNHGFQLSRVAEPRAFAIHGAPVLDAPPGAVLFRGAG